MPNKSITVFCGSKSGNHPKYENQAKVIGQLLAQHQIQLIYGGGNKGIMGAIANSCLDHGGKVIGIIPKVLLEWEAQHTGLTELIVTEDMHARKLQLYERADMALVLPGGMGTFDELFEMLVWNNLKIHDKKIIIFNYDGFYDHLLSMIAKMETEGFLYDRDRYRLIICNTSEEINEIFSAL
jgi:uncharacterized protein (TIGR00730 family)